MSINIAKALKPHSKQRLFIIYCYLTQDSQNLFSIEMLFFQGTATSPGYLWWMNLTFKPHPCTGGLRSLLNLGSAWKAFTPDT